MGINVINKYQNLVISKSGKSYIKTVKFEVENLKLRICIQLQELIKNKQSNSNKSRMKIVWHWVDG